VGHGHLWAALRAADFSLAGVGACSFPGDLRI